MYVSFPKRNNLNFGWVYTKHTNSFVFWAGFHIIFSDMTGTSGKQQKYWKATDIFKVHSMDLTFTWSLSTNLDNHLQQMKNKI